MAKSDNIFVRTYLFLLATLFIGFSLAGVMLLREVPWWWLLVLITLLILGGFLLFVCIFSEYEYANRIAENTGNHWALILIIMLAGLFAAIINKIKGQTP